jgi:hypothetical protein
MPLDIRRQIYHYCLVRRFPIVVNYLRCDEYHLSGCGVDEKVKSILLVSKKIGEEALNVLYCGNVFRVHLCTDGGACLKKKFTEANRRKMRRLQVSMLAGAYNYNGMLDSVLWSPIQAGLTKLSIMARHPLQAKGDHNAPGWQEEMDLQTKWLRPIVANMVQQVLSPCIIEVDDDNRKETSALIKEYLLGGYQKSQTEIGELCFKKWNHSLESGY